MKNNELNDKYLVN